MNGIDSSNIPVQSLNEVKTTEPFSLYRVSIAYDNDDNSNLIKEIQFFDTSDEQSISEQLLPHTLSPYSLELTESHLAQIFCISDLTTHDTIKACDRKL